MGFSIGTKGYIGTGYMDMAMLVIHFTRIFGNGIRQLMYGHKKADFQEMQRSDAVGFSIGNKGYIGTGLVKEVLHIQRFLGMGPGN